MDATSEGKATPNADDAASRVSASQRMAYEMAVEAHKEQRQKALDGMRQDVKKRLDSVGSVNTVSGVVVLAS